MNSRCSSPAEAAAEGARVEQEMGLPVCDVFRDGPGKLRDAVLEFQRGMTTS